MKRRKLSPMPKDELEKLTTKRLLARLNQLHRCEDSMALSDQNVCDDDSSGEIEFKDSAEWINEHDKMKDVLSRREHLPSN